jgi:UPF0271 protein
MKVLDTSAILRSNMDFSDGGYIITNGVLSEVRENEIKDIIDLSIGKRYIKVYTPNEKTLKAIEDAANKTGDLKVLSQTDIEVLAAAYEKKAVIASDDYAIQNVASTLNLPFEKTTQEGIKRKLKWDNVCIGCEKKYPPDFKGTCPICGQKTKRKPL